MLVDIDFNAEKIKQHFAQFAYNSVEVIANDTELICTLNATTDHGEVISIKNGFQKIATGLYWGSSWGDELLNIIYGRNKHTWMDWQWCDFVKLDRWQYLRENMSAFPYWYGIADTPEQVMQYSANVDFFYNNPNMKCFVICSPFVKSSGHDFRWHKNGPYIGTQEPRCESFSDEPLIEEVLMFKVVVLLEENCNESLD